MGLGGKTWHAPSQQEIALKRQAYQLEQTIEYQKDRKENEREQLLEVLDLQRRAASETMQADRRFNRQLAGRGVMPPRMMPPMMSGGGYPMPRGLPPPMMPPIYGNEGAIGRYGLSGVGTRDYGRRAMLQHQQAELHQLDTAVRQQRQANMVAMQREQLEASMAQRDQIERARVVRETVDRANELERERLDGMRIEAERRRAQAQREQADRAQRVQETHLLAAASGHRRGHSVGAMPTTSPLLLPRPPTDTPFMRASPYLSPRTPQSPHDHELEQLGYAYDRAPPLFDPVQARPRTISGPSRLDALRAAEHRQAEAAQMGRQLAEQNQRLAQLEQQLHASRQASGQQGSPPFGQERSPYNGAHDAYPSGVHAATPRTDAFPTPRFRDDLDPHADPRYQAQHPDQEAAYPHGPAATYSGTPQVRFNDEPAMSEFGQYTPRRPRPASFSGHGTDPRYMQQSPAMF